MKYSIIILYHSGFNLLQHCLNSLRQTLQDDIEIIIVMNNSDKQKINIPLDNDRFRIIRIAENLGCSKAANLGASIAQGDYIIFSDHDLIFTDGWFENLIKVHFHSPKVGMTGIKILNPFSLRILDFGIGFTNFNSPHPFLDLPANASLVSYSHSVQAMCAGGLLINKSLFESLGGFDENLNNFYLDIDLCIRLKESNLECWVAADAVAYHFGGDFYSNNRTYKSNFLKADVKASFWKKNAGNIVTDMEKYYHLSWDKLIDDDYNKSNEYIACCLLNVPDPIWYIELLKSYVNLVDHIIRPSGNRDTNIENLYSSLGYDFLKIRSPIVYFVDRFVSLVENKLWWQQRVDDRDLIVDRNANIIPITKLMSMDKGNY